MNEQTLLFDDFQPGTGLGRMTESFGSAALRAWTTLYPWDSPADGTAPLGAATMLMMRAYQAVVVPRPPGNLHVRQQMQIFAPMRAGEAVTTSLTCQGKELKGDRRRLWLRAEATGDGGRRLFDGVITLYWAA